MAYKIKNWDGYFENAHSRKVNKAAWLPLPNKMDGKGYRRVVKMKNSTEIFSAWIVILQVASKMPERGVLKDEDGDITAEDLALMSGFPEKIFTNAFSVLISPKISWLECDSTTMECDSTTMEQYVAEQNRTEQKEQNRTEQNRTEQKEQKEQKGTEQNVPDWINGKYLEWISYRKELKKPLIESTIKQQIKFLEKNKEDAIKIIDQSIMKGWTGLFELDKNKQSDRKRSVEYDEPKINI